MLCNKLKFGIIKMVLQVDSTILTFTGQNCYQDWITLKVLLQHKTNQSPALCVHHYPYITVHLVVSWIYRGV